MTEQVEAWRSLAQFSSQRCCGFYYHLASFLYHHRSYFLPHSPCPSHYPLPWNLALLSSNAKISIRQVEEELVIAFAEIMDLIFRSNSDPWANEFKKEKANNDGKRERKILPGPNFEITLY